MKRIKPTDKNISPNLRRLRLMELSGIPITEKQKKRLQPLTEWVQMVEPTKYHNRMKPQTSTLKSMEEDEVDLEEVLREMGYEVDDDGEDEVDVLKMDRNELKQMIEDIVFDVIGDDYDINEIIENITKNS